MEKEPFLDEKILKMIDQVESPEASSVSVSDKNKDIPPEERTIFTGIKISGQWIEFEARPFVDGKITMMIPKEFSEMDPEDTKIKYPMENRPQTIMMDSSGTINFLFNYMDQAMTNAEAETVRDKLLSIMRRVNPGIKPLTTGMDIIAGKNVAFVEFSNPAIDGKLYNLMFFLEVEGKVLMGSFNCLTKAMKYWKNPAFEMMQSIVIKPKGENE